MLDCSGAKLFSLAPVLLLYVKKSQLLRAQFNMAKVCREGVELDGGGQYLLCPLAAFSVKKQSLMHF